MPSKSLTVFAFTLGLVAGLAIAHNTCIHLACVAEEKPPRVVYVDRVVPISRSMSEERVVKIDRSWKYREVELELTAYTAADPGMDGKGITRSGLPVDRGVIAVDPDVIPLGSIVWVPGVGYLVALDTGGAIKGYKGDIFMHSKNDALRWGRKTVTVRVIK